MNSTLKNKFIFSLIALCSTGNFIIHAQQVFNFSNDSVIARLQMDISVLSHDSMQGRESGSVYEMKARDYITSEFIKAGLTSVFIDGVYHQAFIDTYSNEVFYNIYGFLDNNAEKTIVFGAHYDHVGIRKGQSDSIYNGADDNASGVATVLELARYMKSQSNLKYNYLFIAFAAEEKGLLGSGFFMENFISESFEIACLMNFDMVGRLGAFKNKLIVFGTGTSSAWNNLIPNNNVNDLKLKRIKYAPEFSDHAPFYKKGIPYLYFTTGLHPDYHKTSDAYELINFNGMLQTTAFVKSLTLELDKVNDISFHRLNFLHKIRGNFFALRMMM
ncbi:MAG: M28 family peptidase [Bacteroidales bacterium]|nr:M28 family peptidase [Bacteroidales bacterium]